MNMRLLLVVAIALSIFAVGLFRGDDVMQAAELLPVEGQEIATLAGGCFWCTEAVLQETPGVVDVISGYGGGTTPNPTYSQVTSQATDHREAVQLLFDPGQISYREILDIFLRSIDPTDNGGQFVDRGFSYTTAIFYHDDNQKNVAEQALTELAQSGQFGVPIVTPALPYSTFYAAEDYHQDFYLNSAERYKNYRDNSGR